MTAQAMPHVKSGVSLPKLQFLEGYYYMVCDRQTAEIPKAAGFTRSVKRSVGREYYWTDDWQVAARIHQYADDTAAQEFARIKRSNKGSRAADAEAVIPAPAGLSYMPFQRAGIVYARDHETGCLIGDEPGLGKTIQAIGVINDNPAIRDVLIVVPASLKLNWLRELSKWLVDKTLWVQIAGDTFPVGANIVIVNYDRLVKFERAIRARKWDLIVADEAHMLKNPKARRTQVMHGDGGNKKPLPAHRRVYLTGTPIVNRPAEIYGLIAALRPDIFKPQHFDTFMRKYGSHSPKTRAGQEALERLQKRLRIYVMVRRLKRDVLTELPAKMRQIIELPPGKAGEAVAAEQAAAREYEETMFALRFAVEMAKADPDEKVYTAAVDALKEAVTAAMGQISKLRHATALAKVPEVVKQVEEQLENGSKVVLFAHHRDVIDAYYERFRDVAVKLTGEMGLRDRDTSVTRFQTDPSVKLFIGSIYAAGVGLTLTASSQVMFAELDWVPGQMTQAEDRCHRIGQKDSVLVQHLVLEGSLDVVIAKKLVDKQAVIDAALDAEKGEISDEPIVPVIESHATMDLSRRDVARAAARMTPEDIHEIEAGIDELISRMDVEPGDFNRLDVAIAKALEIQALTPLEAALGRRIVRKYTQNDGAQD